MKPISRHICKTCKVQFNSESSVCDGCNEDTAIIKSRSEDMNINPSDPNYNAALRDAVMDQAPFYDPNHKCGIVREKVFHGCLKELRERNRLLNAELDRGMQTMATAESTIYTLIRERDEARQAYETETLSTAELMAENARLSRIFSVATNNNDKLRDKIDAALLALEEIRTEKLATKGLAAEASAVSAARVLLQSNGQSAGTTPEESA